ncbi:RNA polymerase sigma-70 factor [Streptomyces sp. WMMC500]|uniref:RNA polymerase sigma-70 factor n=1 Tax=Streptomyces sp. WMMC500 TaxID=3015154 RepID=UPI00248CE3AE|nr:RNA polymerase sigma-70 factor [Streptomyces sp. WMMC500]WBB63906.1 RNA polymerase sigma-70 factor [Streptomyces sp. WMMC500]
MSGKERETGPASPAGDSAGDPPPGHPPPGDPFSDHHRLLFGTAYRLLGSVADTEDVLQDAWLAWHRTDRTAVRNPRAYLVRTVTNLSLNRLTSARATRERYVGPWLPEPLLTSPDVADEAELAESVSTAMLVVLETLSPVERAVFVLREAFGFSHAEIAGFLDRPEPTVRQIARRARAHVDSRRPRFDADADRRTEVTTRFMAAAAGGDLNAVMELLAPDVTAWTDGGGVVAAARRPLHGPDHVARWLLGVLRKPISTDVRLRPATINGEAGILIDQSGTVIGTLSYDLTAGLVRHLHIQLNPAKLRGLHGSPPGRRSPGCGSTVEVSPPAGQDDGSERHE